MPAATLTIGNASGFYGDRLAAMRELLDGGHLDVITGDYLAELTMLILGRDRARDPALGYARTFLRQLTDCLVDVLDRGVRIVSNAGGLNPAGLADAIRALGTRARVAYVTGDDLHARYPDQLAANAYLGAWGIAGCLRGGADVVVTGRVTDASLVVGAAAAHHDWQPDDLDALAGATVAGHLLECGTQVTGGNYAFFEEIPDLRHAGFPLAEIAADGSSVLTKQPGTGGAVTVGTVTAQLLYEIAGHRYPGPDVTTRLDTVTLTPDGTDRVRVSGVRGEPPPPTVKVGLTRLGGYRSEVEFVLTGLDIDAKAELVRAQLPSAEWTLARTDHRDAGTEEAASARLRGVVRSVEPTGRAFSAAAVELALASYPGCHLTAPPIESQPYGVFEAAYLPVVDVPHIAVLPSGERVPIAPPALTAAIAAADKPALPPYVPGPTRRAPLGLVAGARSGDKAGSANVGVWARDEAGWPWLACFLTVEQLRELLPEAADLPIRRHVFANLHAVNFVIDGLLGAGVAYNARFDPQAKALGEWLRSRHVDIPESLL